MVVNLGDLNDFPDSQTVSLETVKANKLVKVNGRESRLPLKVCSSPAQSWGSRPTLRAGPWRGRA